MFDVIKVEFVGIYQWLRQKNPSWTASGFGDGNQTRLSNLNQDNVMLGKGNVTFIEIWKSAGS